MPSRGIQIRDPSNQAAADLRLRPRGHRDRQINLLVVTTVYGLPL
jgi:hypothetical protein